jgi:hypothetical protein
VSHTPIERLRQLWTPDNELAEMFADLSPGTELDSMLRDWLHKIVARERSITLNLGSEMIPVVNTGTIRFEIVHGPGDRPELRSRQVTIWHEPE